MKKILILLLLFISVAAFSANRYWVGGNANWDATAGTKWATTSGGTGGAAVPAATDTVYLDNGTGTGNVTIGTGYTGLARRLICRAYTGVLGGSGNITVGGDSVVLGSGMGTITFSGTLTCSLGASTTTLISSGKTWSGGLTFSGQSTYVLADNWTVTGTFSWTNNATLNSNSLTVQGNVTGDASHVLQGTTNISYTGTTGVLSSTGGSMRNNFTIAGNLTIGNIWYNTGTFTYTSGTVSCGTGTLTIGVSTTLNCSGMTGGNAWANITINQNLTLTLSSNLTCSGTLSISNVNLTLTGNTFNIGTGATLTGTNGVISGTTKLVFTGTGTISGTFTSGRIANDVEIAVGAGTITFSGTLNLGGGTFKYTSGTIIAGAGTVAFLTSAETITINASGFSLPNVTATVSETFGGTNGFSMLSFSSTTAGLTHTWSDSTSLTGTTKGYTITGSLNLSGTAASHLSMVSSSGTVQALFTLNKTASAPDVGFVTATRMNNSAGRVILNYRGTHTSTTNWNSLTAPTTVGYTF